MGPRFTLTGLFSPPGDHFLSPALGAHRSSWVILALILLLTCVAYLPAMGGQMLWDDDAHIPRPGLQSLDGLHRIWFDLQATQQYYPLLFSWFWLQYQLWGDHMLGYHVVNLLLHLGAVCLAYLILRRLKIRGALVATAIFALHPIHVESVAWVTEQKNTLSAVFYLSAMLAYLNFDETRRRTTYCLTLVLFGAALLSKTVAVTLPPALLVIFWWQRGRLSWTRDVVPLIPFFALALADGLLTIWVERRIIGAEGSDFELTLAQRFLLAGRATWFYVGQLLWPIDLMFIYPRWHLDPSELWQWLYPLSTLGLLVALWAIRITSRAPLAASLFFVGTLFPVLGFLNVFFFSYSFVSDHFLYLASLGLIVLVAAGIAWLLLRLPAQLWLVSLALCGAVTGILATLTWRQSHLYGSDAVDFYKQIIESNQTTAMPHINLAQLLIVSGRPEEALHHCEEAVRLSPNAAEAHVNWAVALLDTGRTREGAEHIEQALKLQPNSIIALNNFGNLLLKMGRTEEAVKQFEQMVEIVPAFAGAHCNYANALLESGRVQQAIEHFDEAIRLQPGLPEAHHGLGKARVKLGQLPRALGHFEQALAIRPNYAEAHKNMANVLALLDRNSDAMEHFQEALRINPELPEAQNNLGSVLLKMGRPQEAIEHFEQAIRLKRDYAVAVCNLGVALLDAGRAQEAIERFQYSTEIEPAYLEGWANLASANAQLNRSADAVVAARKALELAQAQGQSARARQIEAWLTVFRAGTSKPSVNLPTPALPPDNAP